MPKISCSSHSGRNWLLTQRVLDFLKGSTLDFVKEGLKQAFKFENPNVDAMCGCGESFSVKDKA